MEKSANAFQLTTFHGIVRATFHYPAGTEASPYTSPCHLVTVSLCLPVTVSSCHFASIAPAPQPQAQSTP